MFAVKSITVAFVVALRALQGSEANAAETRAEYPSTQYLKNFALSVCISHGYQSPDVVKDSLAGAGGYLELGGLPCEAYEAADELSKTFLARSNLSHSGSQMVLTKCIDLFSSRELDALAQKFAGK